MKKRQCGKNVLWALIVVLVASCFSGFAADDVKANEPAIIVRSITNELTSFSGKSFPVFLKECRGWAEAREDGTVVIDLKIVKEQQKETVAYLLAHEWGHLVKNAEAGKEPHAKSQRRKGDALNPETIGAAISSREDEREADRFAVKFMAHAGLSVEPFVKFLLAAPDDQRLHYGLHTHDTKEVRAKFIRDAHENLMQQRKISRDKQDL